MDKRLESYHLSKIMTNIFYIRELRLSSETPLLLHGAVIVL